MADIVIAQSDKTAQYVLLTIEPFAGLHYIFGPTRDLKLLEQQIKKYVEGNKPNYMTASAWIGGLADVFAWRPRPHLRSGQRQEGRGTGRSSRSKNDPGGVNAINDRIDWQDKRRFAATYASALMTLDVVLGQFRDFSKIIYLYSCGIPADALLDRMEYGQTRPPSQANQ